MRAWLVVVGLVAACGPSGDDGEAPVEPSPWSYDPGSDRTPTLSADQVASAIERWVPRMRTVEVAPLFDAYLLASSDGDGMCPTEQTVEEGDAYYQIWQADCSTEAGSSYYGYAQYVADTEPGDDGWTNSYRYVYGVASIDTPDGHQWRANGYFSSSYNWKESERYWDKSVQGDHAWDGVEADGTWLAEGLRFEGYAASYTDGTGRTTVVSGGLSGMAGEVVAVSASNLQVLSAEWTPPCPQEPTGSVSVRAADGGWYDVVFDPPTWDDPGVDAAQCDGCGGLWFEGERIGEVCVDLTSMVAWSEAPW